MRKNLLILIATSVVLISSCGNPKTENGDRNAEISGTISIDGSSTVYPLSEAMAEEFGGKNRKTRVTVGESGTGGGFKKFGRGEIDICDASRPIKESEKAVCDSAGISYLELEVAYDGLVVVVNPQNTWVDKLTVSELKTMWETAAQDKINCGEYFFKVSGVTFFIFSTGNNLLLHILNIIRFVNHTHNVPPKTPVYSYH